MIEKTHTELSLNLLFAPKIDVESSESKLDHCNWPKKVNNIGRYRTYFILNFSTEAQASDFNFRDFLNDQNLVFVNI